MNVSAYLDRIRYTGSTNPTSETLRLLHRAHMLAVPFENLDISLGRKIICDEATFIHKVVDLQRGGFCYELNGAFAALLRELGFRVNLLSAGVAREDGTTSPDFDHLTLRVDLQEPWLVDVGFGDSFTEPLRLQADLEQTQGNRTFRLIEVHNALHLQMKESDENWKAQYSFALIPRELEDFAPMCLYHQTSPQSPFTRKKVCSLATAEGRVTLSGEKLILTRSGEREETAMHSELEWHAALKNHFGVVL